MTLELISHTVLVNGAPDRGPGQRVWTIPVAEDVLTSNASPIGVYPSTAAAPPWGAWVGATPHLNTADADTSYGQYTGSVAAADATRGVGIRNGPWTPTSGSTPASCVIEFQAWAAEPVRWSGFVQTNFGGTGSFAAGNITTAESAVAGWVTGSITLGFPTNSTIWGLFTSAVAAGNIITNLRAFLPSGSTLYAGDVRVSKLELKVTMNEEVNTPVPFGRTGCDLLPDGSYVVACYSDMQTLPDVMNVWKVSSDGDILGQLVIDTGADTDGRAHVIALDGFLVQVLYPTGTYEGGLSYVLDCSGDTPVLLNTFNDEVSTVNAYGSPVHHLYLRGPGVVAVCHRSGTSLYRRGRHLISRTGLDATGEVYGMFPHPSDPNKFSAWFSSGDSDKEFVAWEYTVTATDGLLVEALGPFVPTDTIWWMVGGGNPYATMPIALQENENSVIEIIEAGDPTNVLWVDPSVAVTPKTVDAVEIWSTGGWGSAVADTANEYMSSDADGAFAHIGPDQAVGKRVVARLPAITVPAGHGLSMAARVKIITWHTSYVPIKWNLATEASSTPIVTLQDGIYSWYPDDWQECAVFFPGTPAVVAALAAGTAVIWADPPTQPAGGDTGPSNSYEISFSGVPDWDSSGSLGVDPVGVGTAQAPQAINADTISCQVGDSLDHFAFTHELWHENGEYTAPTRTQFTARVGLVDNTTGTPVVDIVDLEYGATSVAGYPDDTNYVSLITGSMDITARNGEVVVSTCIVQQEDSTNYYAVVSWKLSTGAAGRARLSGFWGGQWRQGINNASGLLSLQTTRGMLPEASEVTGLDASAHAAWMQTSQGRELIGRFVDPSEPPLGEPQPPYMVDVVYQLSSINTDLPAAISLAGASFTQYGNTWGPFVAQAGGPPSAISLTDGSDATATTLANVTSNTTTQPVEVFTARLVPGTVVPPGASPVAVAFTLRGRAVGGDAGSYLDLNITTSTNQATVRGQSGNYQLQMAANFGPSFVTSNYGIYGRYPSVFEHPGRFTTTGYTQGQSLATAMSGSDESTALWWAGKLATPGFYITVQNALTNPAHGPVELAELYLTMRYLMP